MNGADAKAKIKQSVALRRRNPKRSGGRTTVANIGTE
jgi:hypothetical protein